MSDHKPNCAANYGVNACSCDASRPAADESAKPVYQFRYFGSGDWMDVSKEEYDRLSVDVLAEDMRFRTLYTHPAPVASKEAVTLTHEQILEIGRRYGLWTLLSEAEGRLKFMIVVHAILASKAEPTS